MLCRKTVFALLAASATLRAAASAATSAMRSVMSSYITTNCRGSPRDERTRRYRLMVGEKYSQLCGSPVCTTDAMRAICCLSASGKTSRIVLPITRSGFTPTWRS